MWLRVGATHEARLCERSKGFLTSSLTPLAQPRSGLDLDLAEHPELPEPFRDR